MALSRQARLKIVLPARLANEVQLLIEAYGGTQYAAAEKTKLPQTRLSRWVHQKDTEIGVNHFIRLQSFIAPDRHKDFLAAFFTVDWKAAYEAYLRWVDLTTQSLVEGTREYWLGHADGVAQVDGETLAIMLRADELQSIQNYWERECYRSHKYSKDEMDRLSVSAERRELARVRILAPLLDFRASAWVERDWEEMDKPEFETFVDAGVKREVILLERSDLLQRLQQTL